MLCTAGFAEASHIPEQFHQSVQNSVRQFCPEIQVKTRIIMLFPQSLPVSDMLESPVWTQNPNVSPIQIYIFVSFDVYFTEGHQLYSGSVFLSLNSRDRKVSVFSDTFFIHVSRITNC